MAETTKVPVKTDRTAAPALQGWRPFETLRREIDRLFDNFDGGVRRWPAGRSLFDVAPFWRSEFTWPATPAVDLVETDKGYEITAELPGLDDGRPGTARRSGIPAQGGVHPDGQPSPALASGGPQR